MPSEKTSSPAQNRIEIRDFSPKRLGQADRVGLWAISPDGSDEVLSLAFKKEFGLLVDLSSDPTATSARLCVAMKYWEIIADRLSKAGWSLAYVSAIDSEGRTIWIVDANGYGKRFVVRAYEMLTAFVELQRTIHEFAVSLIS